MGSNPATSTMQKVTVICDHCEDAQMDGSELGPADEPLDFDELLEDGGPKFQRAGKRWVIKSYLDEDDPIVIEQEHYCPECAALDAVYEGERPADL